MKSTQYNDSLFLYQIDFSPNWKIIFEKLTRLYSLKNNWDGEGAISPDYDLVGSAERYLRDMYQQDELSPTNISASTDGAIVIEFQRNDGYAEVEFFSPTRAEWMEVEGENEPKYGPLNINPNYVFASYSPTQTPSSALITVPEERCRVDVRARKPITGTTGMYLGENKDLRTEESNQAHERFVANSSSTDVVCIPLAGEAA